MLGNAATEGTGNWDNELSTSAPCAAGSSAMDLLPGDCFGGIGAQHREDFYNHTWLLSSLEPDSLQFLTDVQQL